MPKLTLVEPLLMFGLTIAFIWKLRFIHPLSWIAIPILMLLSHLLHRESPRWLGFRVDNLRSGLKELRAPLLLIAVLSLSASLLLRTIRPIGFSGVCATLAIYLPWGLAQQYALNGYFLNRLSASVSGRDASLLAALLFSLVHTPNPFLMAVTLPLGWIATLIYRQHRNLYVLGIAHAVIGFLLFFAVPDFVSRHLRIGPGWFHYRP